MLHSNAMRLSFAQWLIVAALLGFGIGKIASPSLEAQPGRLIFGSDSVSNLPSVIQTDGANSLKVLGK